MASFRYSSGGIMACRLSFADPMATKVFMRIHSHQYLRLRC